MALDRDIYWVGKQWAVTGFGVQACNQKQKGRYDIEGSRLWDDGVQDAIRAEKWVNTDDFDKAIAVAKKYYPAPPGWSPKPPPPQPVPQPEAPQKPVPPTFDMRGNGVTAKLIPVWKVRTRAAAGQDNP